MKTSFLVLVLLMSLSLEALAGEDHDHDHEKPPTPAAPATPPAAKPKPPPVDSGPRTAAPGPRPSAGGCRVNPGSLSNFANGDSYNYGEMVTYLTSSDCREDGRTIAGAAIANGVDFNVSGPFRLDQFASSLKSNQLENARRVELLLGSSIPNQLRINPLGSSELLPLIGQLSLLSPKAARAAMANLIQQEIYQGETQIAQLSGAEREGVAVDLAKTVVTLGGTQPSIVSEFAESVEDMALLSQADSLGKIFRGLSAVAQVEPALAPTFNITASAFNRGLQKRADTLGANNRTSMLVTTFSGVEAALRGGDALESGATELNEAMGALLKGTPLQATQLKKFWKDVIRALANSSSQSALAQAVALSLRPEYVFLPKDEIGRLLLASRNYPELATSLQHNFLFAWGKQWNDLHDGKLKIRTFNRVKDKFFEPLVTEILEMDPYLIDATWLKEVTRRGLVSDDDIEKRFPRLVLANFERREKAARGMMQGSGIEPTLSSLTENLAVMWTLSQTQVPALMKWVSKNEE